MELDFPEIQLKMQQDYMLRLSAMQDVDGMLDTVKFIDGVAAGQGFAERLYGCHASGHDLDLSYY